MKQSPLLWHEEFTKFLKSLKLYPSLADPCLFMTDQPVGKRVWVIIHVDDVLISAKALSSVDITAKLIGDRFKMKSLGNLSFYLGIRVVRDRRSRTLWMAQDSYIRRMAQRLHTNMHASVASPSTKAILQAAPTDFTASKNSIERYQNTVGSVMWPAMQTRPDIAYIAGVLSKYLCNPLPEHINAALRVVRYLQGTENLGICFTGSRDSNDLDFKAYADSSYADDPDTRRSTSGYVFMLAGGPIAWKSGRQSIVTLSTTEAEYVSLTIAAREAIWIGKLLSEIGYAGRVKPVIYEDNQPAIDLTHGVTAGHHRTKHIDVRYHFIREQVDKGAMEVRYVPTDEQAADIMTKPFCMDFEKKRAQLCIAEVPE